MRLPLRWISILHGTVHSDLALTTGVHDHEGVLKAMMAGARVAMLASELLQEGTGAHRRHPAGTQRLDGSKRVHVDQADAGQHEPARRGAARGL